MSEEQLREALAAALPESLGPAGLRRPAIPDLGVESSITGFGVMVLDALLPVVLADRERHAREKAAAELRAAAEELWQRNRGRTDAYHWLADRAWALTDHEETR